MEITLLDVAVFVIIALSTIFSLVRGFVKELLSLATWISSFILGVLYWPTVTEYLFPSLQSEELQKIVGFFVIFLSVLLIGGILSSIVSRVMRLVIFGFFDRWLGIIFGILRGGVITMVLVYFSAPLANHYDWWKNSVSIPYIYSIAKLSEDYLPEQVANNLDFIIEISTDKA